MGVLSDKVAFISGGSSGIGRATALRFAEEGAAVVIASRREIPHEGGLPTHELRGRGESGIHFGRRHGWSVGGAGAVAGDRSYVRGTFLCAQHALKHVVPSRYGKIITLSSNFSHVSVSGLATYCASKAAVIGHTRALAVEYGSYGININCLCPGATQTAMNAHTRADPAVQELWRFMTPLRMGNDGYVAEPADIANAALFLASDASRFMHAACFVVDGGWMAH